MIGHQKIVYNVCDPLGRLQVHCQPRQTAVLLAWPGRRLKHAGVPGHGLVAHSRRHGAGVAGTDRFVIVRRRLRDRREGCAALVAANGLLAAAPVE